MPHLGHSTCLAQRVYGEAMAHIDVTRSGPYAVHGLPLIRLRLQPDDASGSQDWVERAPIDTSGEADAGGTYWLCRCGQSQNKPFCDGSHRTAGFDGTETAARGTHRARAKVMEGESAEGVGVVVRDVRPLCAHAGFCVADGSDVWHMVRGDDSEVHAAMRDMVDHCPSGALTRAGRPDAAHDDEPRLPLRVAVCDNAQYLVTGGASVASDDGTAYEVRNRVSLCRCGASKNKPFCDGSHADPDVAFTGS